MQSQIDIQKPETYSTKRLS